MSSVQVSKSATSKAINFLLNTEDIDFVLSEDNKRRRLFFLNTDAGIKKLEKLIEAHKVETGLLRETQKIRDNNNPELNQYIKNLIDFNEDVLDFVLDKFYKHFKKE